jgi:hypothetical protein
LTGITDTDISVVVVSFAEVVGFDSGVVTALGASGLSSFESLSAGCVLTGLAASGVAGFGVSGTVGTATAGTVGVVLSGQGKNGSGSPRRQNVAKAGDAIVNATIAAENLIL